MQLGGIGRPPGRYLGSCWGFTRVVFMSSGTRGAKVFRKAEVEFGNGITKGPRKRERSKLISQKIWTEGRATGGNKNREKRVGDCGLSW